MNTNCNRAGAVLRTSLKFSFLPLAGAFLLATAGATFAEPIPGQFIAVFKSEVPHPAAAARELGNQHGFDVSYVYQHSIQGFAFAGSEQAAQALARNPRIAYVEPDQLAHASFVSIPTGVGRIGIDAATLENISPGGRNVEARIAIIDTGIQRNHPDLKVVGGVRFFVKGNRIVFDNTFDDDNGHGTHVAGTAAANGTIVGVAPGAQLTAVKVLNSGGSAPFSIVIAGIDWVAGQPGSFDVANMSLGGGYSLAVNEAVKKATDSGVLFVVAAGNANTDVSQMSPASEPSAITVSAMVDYDGRPGGLGAPTTLYLSCKNADGTGGTVHHDEDVPCWSNYGQGVDLCAPGVWIYSTWPTSLISSGYKTISGTSMATPHVTGAAALYLSQHRADLADPATRVAMVTQALTSSGWQRGDFGYFNATQDKDIYPEPLLNVRSLLGETPRPEFAVVINSPVNGTEFALGGTVEFAGTASINGNDATASLVWTSSIDGFIGEDTGFSKSGLSEGTHTIIASVTDPDSSFTGSASVTIVVGEATPPVPPPPAPQRLVLAISTDKSTYTNGEVMRSFFFVTVDDDGNPSTPAIPVEGATVNGVLTDAKGATLTTRGTTGPGGIFEADLRINRKANGVGTYWITGTALKNGYLTSDEAKALFVVK